MVIFFPRENLYRLELADTHGKQVVLKIIISSKNKNFLTSFSGVQGIQISKIKRQYQVNNF